MIKILFVCHGNICRSPMAEYVLKDMVKKAGMEDRFHIDSVAASCEELGHSIYPPARRELEKHGIPYGHHAARLITQADYDYFDVIYYMDSRNARYLNRLFRDKAGKFRPLLNRDVADPWYSGDFTQTWQDISEGCKKILAQYL